MAKDTTFSKKGFSADWLLRGSLTKLGDTLDRFLGRKWVPSSTLATSEIIERIKKLLDAEERDVPGKGMVVPHQIKLKIQWDKFSTESEKLKENLENELLAATVDHINDSLYYTFAPVSIAVEPDYFVEGVQLTASFGEFAEDEPVADRNVTIAGINLGELTGQTAADPVEGEAAGLIVRFTVSGIAKEKRLDIHRGQSISVGRAGSNGLVIDDPSVSKIHASLSSANDGELLLADTGSTNGTFLNGERIAYGKAIKIAASDTIGFGDIEVSFERIEPEPAETDADDAKTVQIDGLEFTSRTAIDNEPEDPEPDPGVEDPK